MSKGASGGSLTVQCRTERKRSAVRRASWGELASGSEARFPSVGRAYWQRVRYEVPRSYPGRPSGLPGGDAGVVIEDERTR
jgi:hypothetical protein